MIEKIKNYLNKTFKFSFIEMIGILFFLVGSLYLIFYLALLLFPNYIQPISIQVSNSFTYIIIGLIIYSCGGYLKIKDEM